MRRHRSRAPRYILPFIPGLLASVFVSSSAMALEEWRYCNISRSPLVMDESLPSGLVCRYDQDGNGLDDEVETELARCFVPQFVFDKRERSLRADEPNGLFSAYRTGENEILLKFSILFAKDGGFVTDDDWFCGDTHDGDSQPVDVVVKFWRGAGSWYAAAVSFAADGPGKFYDRQRPVVYASAGKHHWYTEKHDDPPCSDVTDPASCCYDSVRGDGEVRIPGVANGILGHAPSQLLSRTYVVDDQEVTERRQVNMCRRARGLDPEPLIGFQPFSLSNMGYAASYVRPFWDADPPLNHVRHAIDPDVDGDGRPEAYVLLPSAEDEFQQVAMATDRCPMGAAEDDADGDFLFGVCDPDPDHRSQYVAGGSTEWPTYNKPTPTLLNQTGWNTGNGWYPRGGFWDSDEDGYVEGEDLCPTVPGGGGLRDPNSNWNAWGENLQFSDQPETRDPGFLNRGNVCDPYPATSVRWTDVGGVKQDTRCKVFPRYETGGSPRYSLTVGVGAGRSAFDPNRDEPEGREYQVQPFRCSCVEGTVGGCLEAPDSPCFAETLRRANQTDIRGTGWRPVQRVEKNCGEQVCEGSQCPPGSCSEQPCDKDSEGYCLPLTLANNSWQDVHWDWEAEYKSYPEHFPDGSVTNEPAYSPLPPFSQTGTEIRAGKFALWSATLEGESFSSPPGLAFVPTANARFPEPERTSAGAPLANITSPQSRSLRAAFAQPVELKGRYTRLLGVGSGCELPTLFDPCAVADCGWAEWWEWLVFPPDIERVGGGLIQDWTADDAWFWQRRGSHLGDTYFANGSASDLRVTMEESGHWVESVEGVSAALNDGYPVPALMFIERSSEGARWAVLDAVAQDESTLVFTPSHEGTLSRGVSTEARLITDSRGRGAVLIDPELNTFFAYDFQQRVWLSQDHGEVDLSELASSSLALMGNQLVSLGSNGADGRVLDVLSGGSRSFALSGLVRKGARLTPTVDGSALLMSGGRDASGAHDDVWKLDLAGDGGIVRQRLVADSSSPDPRHASRALLGYAAGGSPISVGSAADGIGLSTRVVGTAGWRAEECLPPSLIGEAVVASSDLWVGAGAELTSEGGPASGASLGGARVGVGARLGTISSGGSLSIGVGAQVAGDAIAAGDIDSRGT